MKYLEDLCGAAVTLLLDEAEDVRVPEDLLEEGELAVRVLPVAVEQVHREQALGVEEEMKLNQDIDVLGLSEVKHLCRILKSSSSHNFLSLRRLLTCSPCV